MPIRPIDPARRDTRPVAPVANAYGSDANRVASHQPHAAPEPSRLRLNGIVARRRARPAGTIAAASGALAPDRASPESAKRAHHIVDRTGPNWENGDYLVGKGRPPKATRWQKGQSGNPRGPKPQEKLDPEAAFEKEILAEFTAKVNGEEVRLNMGTFVVQLLKAGAAKGTVKSQQMLLELFLATVRKSVSREDTPAMEEWEQQAIDQMLEEYGLPAQPVFRKTDRSMPGADASC